MSEKNESNQKYYTYRVQEEIKTALDNFLKGKISEKEYKEIVDMIATGGGGVLATVVSASGSAPGTSPC